MLTIKAKSVLLRPRHKIKATSGKKYVEILVFRSEESKGTFGLQNSTVYKIGAIIFSTTFKNEDGGKVSTHTFCVSAKLMNYKRSFNTAVMKHPSKI